MEPIRLGLIGCGVIGKRHAQTAHKSERVRLVAVADLIPERVAEVADRFSVGSRYQEGLDLLDDPQVEAAILAFPAGGRFPLAMKAFGNGIHVLTEKPVAMDAGQVERMIAARGDLVSVCGHTRMRFSETARQVGAFIASGALGELRVLHCRGIVAPSGPPATPRPTWRLIRAENGGGIMMNWGCYDLDYLLGLTSWTLRPKLVLGKTWTVPPTYASFIAPGSDAETHVTAMIVCAGGEVIHYERSEYTAAREESSWQITGSQASLHLHMVDTKGFTVTVDRATPDRGTVSEPLFAPVEDEHTGMRQQLDDFAAAIREGRRPETGLEEALLVQQITDAIYASAAAGQAVEI